MKKCDYCRKKIGLFSVMYTWLDKENEIAVQAAFVWLFAALSSLFYAPLAVFIYFWQKPYIGPPQLGFMAGSALIHVAYFLILQRGYRIGDLSLVYPLARGTGPTISTFAAILILGERPTPLAIVGALLVAAGVFFLAGTAGGSKGGRKWGAGYGLLTGAIIAAYTLWDKYAVSALLIPPLLQDYCTTLSRVFISARSPYENNGPPAQYTVRRKMMEIVKYTAMLWIIPLAIAAVIWRATSNV